MSSHLHFEQAPPRSWDLFEELCADTFQEEWRDAALVRHGRAGQPQHGVDIVGRNGAIWPIGIQCKKKSSWPVKTVTTTELDEEVEKAKKFKPALKAFYLVSTAPDDQPLQEHARLINEQHEKRGLFTVTVIGWTELVRRATRHQLVAAKHFGSLSSGPASPLIATFRTANAKLLLNDRELGITIREIIHDLVDFPAGRIVVSQQETEDLLLQISQLQATSSHTYDEREMILELRDELRLGRHREASAVAGLELMLGHKALRDYVRVVWEDEAPLLVRSFVEQALDPNFSVVTGLEKMRLYPPFLSDDHSVAVFMQGSELHSVWQHQCKLTEKFPELSTDNVGELPTTVKFRHAVPAVIREILYKMENGISLQEIEQSKWFDMYAWRFTM